MKDPEFREGCVIPGTRYRVVAHLGAGASGSVYDVVHEALGRHFVLKALDADWIERGELALGLRSEWRALGQLQHPNIVAVTDAGTTEGGVAFFVTEQAAGETLQQRMQRSPKLRLVEAVDITLGILSGLDAAHRIGIVHGAIKPSNVLLCGERVKILDAGLRPVIAALRARRVPHAGPYMAPEQAGAKPIDARADLFSVGVLLFEMLAGRHPFEAATELREGGRSYRGRVSVRLAGTVPDAGSELQALLASLLQEDPRLRPESAEVVREALAPLAERYRNAQGSVAGRRTAGVTSQDTVRAVGAIGPRVESRSRKVPRRQARQDDTTVRASQGASGWAAQTVPAANSTSVDGLSDDTIVQGPPTAVDPSPVQGTGSLERCPAFGSGSTVVDPDQATVRTLLAPWSSTDQQAAVATAHDNTVPPSGLTPPVDTGAKTTAFKHDNTVPLSGLDPPVPQSRVEPGPTRTAAIRWQLPDRTSPSPGESQPPPGGQALERKRGGAKRLLTVGLVVMVLLAAAIARLCRAPRRAAPAPAASQTATTHAAASRAPIPARAPRR